MSHKTWNRALAFGCCMLLLVLALSIPAIWQWVEKWAPALRDVLSLGLALLGGLLARQAIKLNGRQVAIAEREHERWLVEQSMKLDLRMTGSEMTREWSSKDASYGPVVIVLKVKNGSEKTADGFFWEMLVPRHLKYNIKFLDLEGAEVPGRFHPLAKDDIYDSMHGHYTHKLFGWSTVDVCKLRINSAHPSTERFWVKWRISCEDGGVPKGGGYAKIHYKRSADGMFATYDPSPNGDQDHLPDTVVDQGAE